MRILCVCKGNTCRSPMFAAILKNWCLLNGLEHQIESAGCLESAKGQPAAPDWATLQAETAVDLSEHRSRWIGDLDLAAFDLVLCMDPATMFEVGKLLDISKINEVRLVNAPDGIPNPWQKGTDAYRECYSTIVCIVPSVL